MPGFRYRDKEGKIKHNPEREMIQDMDALPWVADVYKRDLQIEKYFIGYLLHPYVSLYTGRGCPAQCTFCLWPQTIGGHKYRVRSPQNVADEMAYMKKLFPQVQEFFFDDDTFTANLPRAREIAKKLAPARPDLELQQPRQPGLRHHQVVQGFRPAPVPGRLRERQRADPQEHQERRHAGRDAPLHQGLPPGGRGRFTARSSSACRSRRRQTIEKTIRFAQELDVFSMQVSLAAPYPGTELYEMARQNGWFVKKDKTDLVEDRRLPAKRPRISRPEQGRDLRGRGPLLPRLLPAPQADPAHHQDDAGGQGRLRPPLPRGLRVLQEHGATAERPGRGEGGGLISARQNWSLLPGKTNPSFCLQT